MITRAPYHYKATDAIEAWLRVHCAARRRDALVSVLVLSVLAVIAHGALYAGLFFLVLNVRTRSVSLHDDTVAAVYLLAPVAVLALAHLVYWVRRRREFVRVSVPGGDVSLNAEQEPPLVLLPASGEGDAHLDLWKIVVFPAWLTGYAVDQLVAAAHLRHADTEAMAALCMYLLQSDRRVSFADLGRDMGSGRLAGALRALRHIPGVLLFTEDFPAVALNQDLSETLDRVARRGCAD
ncbi:MAG: hypothetical protein IT463_01065 [Planctomycetes bacterium]|nr:hypothetical protein [Planctomycetota bacterium]